MKWVFKRMNAGRSASEGQLVKCHMSNVKRHMHLSNDQTAKSGQWVI